MSNNHEELKQMREYIKTCHIGSFYEFVDTCDKEPSLAAWSEILDTDTAACQMIKSYIESYSLSDDFNQYI